MKTTGILATTALLLVCGSARAGFETRAERDFKSINAQIAKGEHELSRTRRLTTDAAKLYALDLSIDLFRSARTTATKNRFDALRKDAERDLVRAFDAEAEIYFNRRSLPLAKDRVVAAIAIDPADARALNLIEMIKGAEYDDIAYTQPNSVAGRRVYQRRAAINSPLRGRGTAMGVGARYR